MAYCSEEHQRFHWKAAHKKECFHAPYRHAAVAAYLFAMHGRDLAPKMFQGRIFIDLESFLIDSNAYLDGLKP